MARLTALKPRLGGLRPGLAVPVGRIEQDRARAKLPWRGWYKTARWQHLRLLIFGRDLFTCQWPGCGRIEGDTSKLVADHIVPHRGDERLFWDEGNLQTLCKPCHDSKKQRAERQAG